MANSKSHRWLKSVLTPTINILENAGWGAGVCQALLTDPPPAHPESHATLNSSGAKSQAYFLGTGRKSGWRILNSLMDMADTHPTRCWRRGSMWSLHSSRAWQFTSASRLANGDLNPIDFARGHDRRRQTRCAQLFLQQGVGS